MSRQSFRHLKNQNLSTDDDFIYSSGISLLVPFLATRVAVTLLANDQIMLGTSIQLNIKICLQTAEIILLVPFLATGEAVVPLANHLIM